MAAGTGMHGVRYPHLAAPRIQAAFASPRMKRRVDLWLLRSWGDVGPLRLLRLDDDLAVHHSANRHRALRLRGS